MALIRKLKILCENNNTVPYIQINIIFNNKKKTKRWVIRTLYSNKRHLQQQEENKTVGVGSQCSIKRCSTGMKCSHQQMCRNQMT